MQDMLRWLPSEHSLTDSENDLEPEVASNIS